MGKKIGAIIQARTTSTRFPGKVLKPLPFNSKLTVLQQVIRRVKKSNLIKEVIIATTENKEDDKIIDIAKKENVLYFRGSENDVLSRYYLSAVKFKIDIIVRITSDCPCIDWNIIDLVINNHLNSDADYTSNTLKRTFPHGLDVEVISLKALKIAFENAKEKFEREHVCPYINTTNKHKFKITNVEADEDCFAPHIRITLDTKEDYTLLCAVFDFLYPENEFFQCKNIISLFKEKPWLQNINKNILQKKIFLTDYDEIKEAIKLLELQDLHKAKRILEGYIR